MKVSSFLQKRLSELLEERRIIVWYDGEGDFQSFVSTFEAPGCEVLSAAESILKSRRRSDEIYRKMNESDDNAERERSLLIYVPRHRGVSEDDKRRDPFEVYAVAGTAFGDSEDEKLKSLARQAMPEKVDEIDRLFREGKPDIALLDGLGKSHRWPLLKDVFGTETPAEIIASALCNDVKADSVDEKPGCLDELLRLMEASTGFSPKKGKRDWRTLRGEAAGYVLFSEFVLDLPKEVPEALSAVPYAGGESEKTIYAACERMRADSGLKDTYMRLASKVERDLRLDGVMPQDFNPGERDTFPFEERRLLKQSVERIVSGDIDSARKVIEDSKGSIWRSDSERSPGWTALERAVALLETAENISASEKGKGLSDLIKGYTDGGWFEIDRAARRFEVAVTACMDDSVTPVVDYCRNRYRESILGLQERFLQAVKAEGWPPESVQRQTRVFDDYIAPLLEQREKTAFFMVDSLRYEMGRDLAEALQETGAVETACAACSVPTVTESGMAALLPGADGRLRFVEKEGDLVPALGTRLLKVSSDRMKLLKEIYGDRFLEMTLDKFLGSQKKAASQLEKVDFFVVRTQDPDLIGEEMGAWHARKYLSDVVSDILGAVRRLFTQGFTRVVISADHGHLMLPEIAPGDVVKKPPGEWLMSKRRCLLGSGAAETDGTVTLKAGRLGIQGDVEDFCMPVGYRVFSQGEGYFHEGLSLQEALVPVVMVRGGGEGVPTAGRPEVKIRYRSDKFTSRVIGLKVFAETDLFGAPIHVLIEAFDGTGPKASLVGGAADCEARDEKTHVVTLEPGNETPVPVLINPDFDGPEVEIRVSEAENRVVWARLKLKNAMLD